MATSAQGNSFSEDDLLALQGGVAKRTWYRMCHNDMFCSIEWGSLSGELVNSHHSLFTIDEVAKLSSGKPCSKEAVESALKRNPQRVLHAIYKSLCATQTRGGAGQHAIIAREIQKETLSAAFNKSETYPPAARSATILPPAGPRWPANSQLASAEPDLGLDVALAHATADTAQPPPWQMGGAPAMEEWEGVVDFTCHYFGANARRDVLCTLYREVDETAHRFLCSNPSNQRLSEALQEVVQKRRMKWFRFAQYLLRSKVTCPFVFDIPKYTHVSIRDTFKQVLRRELGRNWFQLASAMGLPRTDIEDIQEQTGIPLSHKIDTFLVKFQFPSFISDRGTTDFLVEALERASLPYIAAAVRRQLEFALQQEATESTVQYTHNQAVATAQRAKPYVADNKKSECPSQTAATPPVSSTSSGTASGTSVSHSPMRTVRIGDIVTDLEHHLDARWKHFGVHLKVEWSVLESIEKDRVGRTDDCMLELMGKWVFFPNGNRVPASHMADNSGGREENRIWRPRRKHSIQAWSGSDL